MSVSVELTNATLQRINMMNLSLAAPARSNPFLATPPSMRAAAKKGKFTPPGSRDKSPSPCRTLIKSPSPSAMPLMTAVTQAFQKSMHCQKQNVKSKSSSSSSVQSSQSSSSSSTSNNSLSISSQLTQLHISTSTSSSSSCTAPASSPCLLRSPSSGASSQNTSTCSKKPLCPTKSNNTLEALPVHFVCADGLVERIHEARSRVKNGEFPADLFVLDCRSFIAFNLKYITGALNITCADRCSRRRLNSGKTCIADMVKGTDAEKEAFKDNFTKGEIVLYDDNTEDMGDMSDANSAMQLVYKVLQLQGANVFFLKGGLKEFETKYGHMCSECNKPAPRVPLYSPTTPLIQEPAIDTATASQVLPFLYLGNERDAANEERLLDLGITHVLNVTAHIPLFFETSMLKIQYKRLPASDSAQQNLRQYFESACQFIDSVRACRGKVLIHCQAGVSRSATITIAYIMKHSTLSMQEAFRFVKSRRAIVSPNFNFMGQLYGYEQAIAQGSELRDLENSLDLGDMMPPPAPSSPSMHFNLPQMS